MGYQYGEKYDRNATLSVLQKKFPTLDKSLMNARATAITQRENPFQHGGKSYYWRYDTIMSITPNKEKYEKTQDTKDMKEYKEKIAPTIQSIEVSKNMAKDGNIE
ncbi:MAG: hypothetical protein H6766_04435 [Candidatus Peribacteria bacterium]|nr:MAG: hypothetical protein H6766_04435 [Candidatus Peribacteria bacterium]